jgi:hypothetical protein
MDLEPSVAEATKRSRILALRYICRRSMEPAL